MKRVRRFNGKDGSEVTSDETPFDPKNPDKETRFNAADPRSLRAYNRAAKMYELDRGIAGSPENDTRLNKTFNSLIRKLPVIEDAVGDKIRSAGKFLGLKRTMSQDDAAHAAARRDVKGYAKGGSVSIRGDGIAQRGKTKGRMV